MATENVAHETAEGHNTAGCAPQVPDFTDAAEAISYASHHAARMAESINAIRKVMGPAGVSPDPVDYAEYSLRQMAGLREVLNTASHAAIELTVEGHGGSVKELAAAAGVSHTTVYRRLDEAKAAKTPIPIPKEHLIGHAKGSKLPFGKFVSGQDVTVANLYLGRDRWTSVYGNPGAGKTNLCRNLALQAARRDWPITVVTTQKDAYEFSGASVVSVPSTAVKELSGIIDDGAEGRTDDYGNTTPRLVIIDGLLNFVGSADQGIDHLHRGGDGFDEVRELIVELISRAEELGLMVVTTVQSLVDQPADARIHSSFLIDCAQQGIKPAEHSHLVLGGTGGPPNIEGSEMMRVVPTFPRTRGVLRTSTSVPGKFLNIVVHPWHADEETLRSFAAGH